jgi:hypothetical protein
VRREIKEELDIEAEFLCDKPILNNQETKDFGDSTAFFGEVSDSLPTLSRP